MGFKTNLRIGILILTFCFALLVLLFDFGFGIEPEVVAGQARAASGSEIYARHCAQCHGMDGRARTAKGKRTGATDFTTNDWNTDEARALRIIANGKDEMPSFKGKLSQRDIKAAWSHVLRFRR